MVASLDSAAGARADRQTPVKMVCFRLHGQEYGVDIADVKETMTLRPITRVFLTPPWLCGIINLRGDIVAVLDLAQLLGLPPAAVAPDSRIIICRHNEQNAGIVVDEMAELRLIDPARIAPPPSTLAGDTAALLCGITTLEDGAPLRILAMDSLFQSERLRALQRERA